MKKLRLTKAKAHLSAEEIDKKIKECSSPQKIKKWLVIRHALVLPSTAEEISKTIGLAKQTVHNLISAYNRLGPEIIDKEIKHPRNNANLTLEQETEFLKEFFEKAKKGLIPTVKEIHEKLESKLGAKVDKVTAYRLLHRHKWFKKVPRPYNPDADKEAQEDFKKISN
jgi:transposase